jgi:outer membrane protein TolC
MVLCMVWASCLFGQQQRVLSLEEAILMAKQNNTEIKIGQKEIEKQQILKKTAFQVDPLHIQYQGGQFNSKAYDHNLTIQQYFPLPKATDANQQWQDELIKLAQKRKALSSYDLEKIITQLYYQYLHGIALQKLNIELEEIYSKFFKNAQSRLKTGDSGDIEVISAKAKIKEIETHKQQLADDLAIYQKQLQYFVQTTEYIMPDISLPLQYTPSQLTDNNQLEGLLSGFYQQQIMAYRKEAQVYKFQNLPKIGLSYFAQSIDSKWFFQGFMAGIQIPIFSQANKAKAQAMMISQEQTQLEMDKNKLLLKLRQQQLNLELEKHKKGLEYYQNEGLKYANQIISTAQKSYAQGDMNYWLYVSFLNQAIDLKKQHLEALNLYNQSAIKQQFPSINNT